ncbi:hypothetical protein [Paraburkholderia bannensis]|nr:hypothetical protein [Paraburkholderia bannensis]
MQKIDRTQLANVEAAGGCCKSCCSKPAAPQAPAQPPVVPR